MNLLPFINKHLIEVDFDTITTIEAKTCRDFDDLMSIYRRNMTVTDSLIECMAILCAVHLAIKLDGDPLWMYLVGSPSSGKSTLCELLSADERNTKPISKFTGLISGSAQGSHLIPRLQNKCVIVKDGTLLLESTPIQLANVYGELRDIYDGSLEADYRNGVKASFKNISFGMIIGITEKIYSINTSALGERFLHCRLETNRVHERERNECAIDAVFQSTKRTMGEGEEEADSRSFPFQRSYTAGFLGHLHARVKQEDVLQPEYTADDKLLIQALADVVACSRAQAPKDAKDEIMYDSSPESSTRVVKVLCRLALCLCYVFNTYKLTNRLRHHLIKVAKDSARVNRQFGILDVVSKSKNGLTRTTIAAKCDLAHETTVRSLNDLMSMNIVEEQNESIRKSSGARNKIIRCTPDVQDAFRKMHYYASQSEGVSTPKKTATNGFPGKKKVLKAIKKKMPVKR